MKDRVISTTPILRFQIIRQFMKKFTIHHVFRKLVHRQILFLYPVSSVHKRGGRTTLCAFATRRRRLSSSRENLPNPTFGTVDRGSASGDVLRTGSGSAGLGLMVRLRVVLGFGFGSGSCSSSEAEESRIFSLDTSLRDVFGDDLEGAERFLLVDFGRGLVGWFFCWGRDGSCSSACSSGNGCTSEGLD